MILLYTDFGWCGPYVGQMKARILAAAPGVDVVDLMHDAPRFRPREAGVLLAAQVPWLPDHAVIVAVVDPGVGSDRRALIARVGHRWFVGPDNGLLAPVLTGDVNRRVWTIPTPGDAAPSFHGRDVFAPAGGRLASTGMPTGAQLVDEWIGKDEPVERPGVIYVDSFGNVITGRRAASLAAGEAPRVGDVSLPKVRTFSDVGVGEAFWYENSVGLVEVAVNQGSAARRFGLSIGDPITFVC